MATLRHGHVEGGDSWDEVAYLHDPDELAAELAAARLAQVEVLGVEGPAGAWARNDPALNAHALELAQAAERAMAAASIHLLARGVRAG